MTTPITAPLRRYQRAIALAGIVVGLCAGCTGGGTVVGAAEPLGALSRPNVIIVVADDLGFNDVGYNGSEVATPRLDAWIDDALRFSRFYSNVVCSPTRAGLMTGRWPIRFGMMRNTVEPGETFGLPSDEETIAEAFARGGYRQRALIGKWHLGDQRQAYLPNNNGFTSFFGHLTGGLGYFIHEREGVNDLHRDFEPVLGTNGQYLTHMLADEAVAYLESRGADRDPFLLYLAPFNPHRPNETLPEYIDANSGITDSTRRTHAGMVTAFDHLFGRVLDTLEARGLSDNTIVVFMSDNGGDIEYAGANANAPLRGEKATVFEGGMRVPAAIRWPAGGLRGGTVVDARVGYIDVMPTVMAAAGVPLGDRTLDGVNLLPVLRGQAPSPTRDWFAYIGARNGLESLSVTHDGWKLIRRGRALSDPDAEEGVQYLLFRIDDDPSEANDLAVANPDVVAALRERLATFRALEPEDGVRRRPIDPNWTPFPNWTPPA